jgi:hypothetical protein
MEAADINMMSVKLRLALESSGIWAHIFATLIRKNFPEGLIMTPQDLVDTNADARLLMVQASGDRDLKFKLVTREEAEILVEQRRKDAELANAQSQGSA